MDEAPTSSKKFAAIRADYEFFQSHSTECAEDVRAYLPYLARFASGTAPIRALDFGCGDGLFSAELWAKVSLLPSRLELSLVEPDDVYRESALQRLRPFAARQPQAWPALPPDRTDCFDLVLSNHVLYYVTDLDGTIAAILRGLAAGGLFVTAMADRPNGLIQLWERCFALLGIPVPFHTSEELETVLTRHGQRYEKMDVRFELSFPDSEEHRLSIMRFLLGSYYPQVPRQAMLDLFNPYLEGSQVKMRLVHQHFAVLRPPSGA